MSTANITNNFQESALSRAILGARYGKNKTRSEQRRALADISSKNAQIAEGLIVLIKKLNEKELLDEASELIASTKALLDNNKELQIVVSTVLPDKD